jgi:hypothetical protein
LPVHDDNTTTTFFHASTTVVLGNGRATMFWTDPWLDGYSLAMLTPDLVQAVSRHRCKGRSVMDALNNGTWIQDISGPRTIPVMMQFVLIFQKL